MLRRRGWIRYEPGDRVWIPGSQPGKGVPIRGWWRCATSRYSKTSVAVEYAYRHLAEVGVAWQFPAEDPAVLVPAFAQLAAQLGVREVLDVREHRGLGARRASRLQG